MKKNKPIDDDDFQLWKAKTKIPDTKYNYHNYSTGQMRLLVVVICLLGVALVVAQFPW